MCPSGLRRPPPIEPGRRLPATGRCPRQRYGPQPPGRPTHDPVALDRRLRAAFGGHLPRAVRNGRWPVALDLTLIPYHGRPFADPAEVYRSQPKSGTTHFHAYATAYLVRDGQRFTLALIAVRKGTPMADVVRDLCRRVRATGVNAAFS